jgi:hypothetical protein
MPVVCVERKAHVESVESRDQGPVRLATGGARRAGISSGSGADQERITAKVLRPGRDQWA